MSLLLGRYKPSGVGTNLYAIAYKRVPETPKPPSGLHRPWSAALFRPEVSGTRGGFRVRVFPAEHTRGLVQTAVFGVESGGAGCFVARCVVDSAFMSYKNSVRLADALHRLGVAQAKSGSSAQKAWGAYHRALAQTLGEGFDGNLQSLVDAELELSLELRRSTNSISKRWGEMFGVSAELHSEMLDEVNAETDRVALEREALRSGVLVRPREFKLSQVEGLPVLSEDGSPMHAYATHEGGCLVAWVRRHSGFSVEVPFEGPVDVQVRYTFAGRAGSSDNEVRLVNEQLVSFPPVPVGQVWAAVSFVADGPVLHFTHVSDDWKHEVVVDGVYVSPTLRLGG